MSQIIIKNLRKQWDSTVAVDDISFEVGKGKLTVLLGPSGCGKSTILRLIAGLEEVSSGQIFIEGTDVTSIDPSKRGVSMVFQSYALFPHLNVQDNILFGLRVRKEPSSDQRTRLEDVSTMLGLQDLLTRKPSQLSGGQRQRVALARSIVSRQPICLMDEPLSNLDARLRAEMRDEIRNLQQKLGLTMIYVTHDQVEAMTMADQVVLLQAGKIEQIGSPKELYESPLTSFSARFMGSPPMNLFPVDLIRTVLNKNKNPNSYSLNSTGMIGVRPEDIRVEENGLPVQVSSTDYLGGETILRFILGDQIFAARINGHCSFEPGGQLSVHWHDDAIHQFGADGVRIDIPEKAP